MSTQATRTNGRAPRVPLLNSVAPAPQPAGQTLSLDAAVAIVQASAPQLSRNARGQIGARQYGYVTLDAVVAVVLPLLDEHGLVWKTFPTALEDGAPALRYRMTHTASGEFDEDVMPLECDRTSQGLGSGITYARRYALTAYLNLTVDPDDDGAAASVVFREPVDKYADIIPTTAAAPEHDPAPSPQPTARPARSTERRATAKQQGMLRARAGAAGLEPEAFANVILVAAGGERRTWANQQAAAGTLKRLLDQLPASLVDAVIEGVERS